MENEAPNDTTCLPTIQSILAARHRGLTVTPIFAVAETMAPIAAGFTVHHRSPNGKITQNKHTGYPAIRIAIRNRSLTTTKLISHKRPYSQVIVMSSLISSAQNARAPWPMPPVNTSLHSCIIRVLDYRFGTERRGHLGPRFCRRYELTRRTPRPQSRFGTETPRASWPLPLPKIHHPEIP